MGGPRTSWSKPSASALWSPNPVAKNHLAPARARQRILDIAATQLETGGAYHQYQPLTKRGNDAIGSNFNDDPLWLVLSTTASTAAALRSSRLSLTPVTL